MRILYWLDLAKKMDLRWHLVLFTIIQDWKKKQQLNYFKKLYILLPGSLQFISRPLVCLLCHWGYTLRIQLCVTIIFEYFCVCVIRAKILKIKLQLSLLSTLKKKKTNLHIHLYFILLHQTHLVLFISFKLIHSKSNLNVSYFPALLQTALFI